MQPLLLVGHLEPARIGQGYRHIHSNKALDGHTLPNWYITGPGTGANTRALQAFRDWIQYELGYWQGIGWRFQLKHAGNVFQGRIPWAAESMTVKSDDLTDLPGGMLHSVSIQL